MTGRGIFVGVIGLTGFAVAAAGDAQVPNRSGAKPASSAGATGQSGETVTVTGRRLSETGAALATCVARGCSPSEDIAATVTHADTLFAAGNYAAARIALGKSISRNRRHARDLPTEVAGLSRAYARVSAHMGHHDAARLATFAAVDALREGLGDNDPRVLAQRLDTADMFARAGEIDIAASHYRRVARQGQEQHLPLIEGRALLRLSMLYRALARVDRASWERQAQLSLNALQSTTSPELAPFRESARLIEAQMADRAGDKTAIDRLIASYRGERADEPKLIHAPLIAMPSARSRRHLTAGSVTMLMPTDYLDDQWIDIGFWIEEDGRVSETSLVRQSPKLRDFWVAPILTSISARRYAPLNQRTMRVERYSRTAQIAPTSQTRIPQRAPDATIEMLDLTASETDS